MVERQIPQEMVELVRVAASAGGQAGTIWTLEGSEDLNANLVRFDAGQSIEEHVNEEVDVLLVGVSGSGSVTVEQERYALAPGGLVFAPKNTRRSVLAGPEGLAYLSVHRRRSLPGISRRKKATQTDKIDRQGKVGT